MGRFRVFPEVGYSVVQVQFEEGALPLRKFHTVTQKKEVGPLGHKFPGRCGISPCISNQEINRYGVPGHQSVPCDPIDVNSPDYPYHR